MITDKCTKAKRRMSTKYWLLMRNLNSETIPFLACMSRLWSVYHSALAEQIASCYVTVTSKWAQWGLKSPASRLFTQAFIQAPIKETSKLRVTSLCVGNSPVTGKFPAWMASNAENVSIWWRHHELTVITTTEILSNCPSSHPLEFYAQSWSVDTMRSSNQSTLMFWPYRGSAPWWFSIQVQMIRLIRWSGQKMIISDLPISINPRVVVYKHMIRYWVVYSLTVCRQRLLF